MLWLDSESSGWKASSLQDNKWEHFIIIPNKTLILCVCVCVCVCAWSCKVSNSSSVLFVSTQTYWSVSDFHRKSDLRPLWFTSRCLTVFCWDWVSALCVSPSLPLSPSLYLWGCLPEGWFLSLSFLYRMFVDSARVSLLYLSLSFIASKWTNA